MGLSFANPAGFWALLALPAVLVIHLFQRRSRTQEVSTLFLIEPSPKESVRGRRLERLRSSASLWLQLLASVVLTWILVQPRWIREDSVQRIVVLMDSSASMSAFRDAAVREVEARLERAARLARRSEWILLETHPRRGTLYAGGDRREAAAALRRWFPVMGAHDAARALDIARAAAADAGAVIFVTDHRADLPPDVELLSVGAPTANAGFAGVRVDAAGGLADAGGGEPVWHALLRNYGDRPQVRAWSVEAAGALPSAPVPVRLEPDALLVLSGRFPAGVEEITLTLDGDAFGLDDRLPVIVPRPKVLGVAVAGVEDEEGFTEGFMAALAAVDPAVEGEEADLTIAWRDPGEDRFADTAALVFLRAAGEPGGHLPGDIVAESHPLTAGLSWQGLLARETPGFAFGDDDTVILWQGSRPLLAVRQTPAGGQLVFNFAVSASNARRLPATVLLAHRFVETIRAAKPAYEQRNVETGQRLAVAGRPGGNAPRLVAPSFDGAAGGQAGGDGAFLRAPLLPCFFGIEQDGERLLSAAAHFADAREGDLRRAERHVDPRDTDERLVVRNSRVDPYAPLWILLLGAILLADWHVQGRRTA